jgi:hypothetical protein
MVRGILISVAAGGLLQEFFAQKHQMADLRINAFDQAVRISVRKQDVRDSTTVPGKRKPHF